MTENDEPRAEPWTKKQWREKIQQSYEMEQKSIDYVLSSKIYGRLHVLAIAHMHEKLHKMILEKLKIKKEGESLKKYYKEVVPVPESYKHAVDFVETFLQGDPKPLKIWHEYFAGSTYLKLAKDASRKVVIRVLSRMISYMFKVMYCLTKNVNFTDNQGDLLELQDEIREQYKMLSKKERQVQMKMNHEYIKEMRVKSHSEYDPKGIWK